ncbi:hypothetical protein ACA910_013773 [Epithemia clementina (nom. ined.)]
MAATSPFLSLINRTTKQEDPKEVRDEDDDKNNKESGGDPATFHTEKENIFAKGQEDGEEHRTKRTPMEKQLTLEFADKNPIDGKDHDTIVGSKENENIDDDSNDNDNDDVIGDIEENKNGRNGSLESDEYTKGSSQLSTSHLAIS